MHILVHLREVHPIIHGLDAIEVDTQLLSPVIGNIAMSIVLLC